MRPPHILRRENQYIIIAIADNCSLHIEMFYI